MTSKPLHEITALINKLAKFVEFQCEYILEENLSSLISSNHFDEYLSVDEIINGEKVQVTGDKTTTKSGNPRYKRSWVKLNKESKTYLEFMIQQILEHELEAINSGNPNTDFMDFKCMYPDLLKYIMQKCNPKINKKKMKNSETLKSVVLVFLNKLNNMCELLVEIIWAKHQAPNSYLLAVCTTNTIISDITLEDFYNFISGQNTSQNTGQNTPDLTDELESAQSEE